MLCCTVKVEAPADDDRLAKATEDIGYDDISDDELDDLIEAAEDEQEDKPTGTIGNVVINKHS